MRNENEDREILEKKLAIVKLKNLLTDTLKEDAGVGRITELYSEDRLIIMTASEEAINYLFPVLAKEFKSQNRKITAALGLTPITHESLKVHAFLILREDLVPKVGQTGDTMENFKGILGGMATNINNLYTNMKDFELLRYDEASIKSDSARLITLSEVIKRKPAFFMATESIRSSS